MKTKRNSKDSASILLCVLGVIVILSVIGATVLRSSTARLNASTNQVRAWKQALSAAETGGDVAFAEIRKATSADSTVRASQWNGWTQSGSTYISPSPTSGSSGPVSQSVVEKCYFDASGNFQPWPVAPSPSPTSNAWYRVRSKGTVPLPGLKRTGMDDALIADGQKHFAAIGSTQMQDITARGKGDSLLRKIDFQYDHFIATYGPKGDGVGKKSEVAAFLAPSISRRIEQIVAPVTPFSDAAIKTLGTFEGPGAAAVIDSYDSRKSPYTFVANDPTNPRYPDSHHGSVQIGNSTATVMGMIYGNVATNGGTVTGKIANVIKPGSIDNNVPFTLEDYHLPAALSGRLPEQPGTGTGQLPNAVTAETALTPPAAGTADNPVYYKISSLTQALTIKPTTAGTPTFVALHVTGDITGNSAGITVNKDVRLQVYFEGNIDVKNSDLVNQNPSSDNPVAGNLQFYGVSPARDANGIPVKTQSVQLNSGPPRILAMTFYAPSASVDIRGNPDFIGSMVCKIFYGNGNVNWHYDRALNGAGEVLDFRIASYVEDTR